jgi:hypothetical protein
MIDVAEEAGNWRWLDLDSKERGSCSWFHLVASVPFCQLLGQIGLGRMRKVFAGLDGATHSSAVGKGGLPPLVLCE